MPTLPHPPLSLKPSVVAALFLVTLDLLRQLTASLPGTVAAVLATSGSSRSQAYEMKRRLLDACAQLHEPVGRPAAPPRVSLPTATVVTRLVRDWVFAHPGAVDVRGHRCQYSVDFRAFVVGLATADGPASGLTIAALVDAVGVPLGTLKDWLAASQPSPSSPDIAPPNATDVPAHPLTSPSELAIHPDVATILMAYRRWEGGFAAFCVHLCEHHGLRYGRTFVASVLEAAGLRTPKRRPGTQAAPWSRGTFRRFFPGAQWLGDGTELAVELDGERFVFNLEAVVDVYTNATVGIDVTDTENEDAILRALHNGLRTTGQQPLAVSLDNKPCNHTDLVSDSMAPTEVLRSTPGRGQAKAAVEGAFGLFQQTAPPLQVGGDTPRELARSVMRLCVTLWMWGRNGRPRPRLWGRSPAQAYRDDQPDAQQIEAARQWIADLQRRAERARQSAENRADPVRRTLLREGLARLAINDPGQRLEIALTRYATEAIIRGLATFAAKDTLGTVPPDADRGPYLGGVIRNINDQMELQAMADQLLDLRVRRRDLTVEQIQAAITALRRTTDTSELPKTLVQQALAATLAPAYRLFLSEALAVITALPTSSRAPLVSQLIRHAAARFDIDKRRRADVIASLTSVAR